jgi:hypothetical protein
MTGRSWKGLALKCSPALPLKPCRFRRSGCPYRNSIPLAQSRESGDAPSHGFILKLICWVVIGLFRSRASLEAEIVVLRHQLSDCVGSQARFRSARHDDVCVFQPRQGERFRAPARAACGLDTSARHRFSLAVRSMLRHGPAPRFDEKCQGLVSRKIALSRTASLRATAIKATILTLPAPTSRS